MKILTTDVLKDKIYKGLLKYKDPYLATDLVDAGCVKDLIIDSRQIILNLNFGFLLDQHIKKIVEQLMIILEPLIDSLATEIGIRLELEINTGSQISAHTYKQGLERLQRIKNIIAVGSGKGGVGKSTVAVNLAMALHQQGAKVGIVDADLYGPSLPHMLGCKAKIKMQNNKLQPNYIHGIYCISIGNLLDEDSPIVWRGPMVSSGLLQLLYDTIWPELDYLIIDLPPGTGDLQLTLAQKIPVTGALIVTTPQPIALLDAQKALIMLQKLDVKILGLIENMSVFVCENCHYEHEIFGTSGGLNLANKYQLRLLGNIPLDLNIRLQSDLGTPTVLVSPHSRISKIYHDIASSVAAELSKLPKDLAFMNSVPIVID